MLLSFYTCKNNILFSLSKVQNCFFNAACKLKRLILDIGKVPAFHFAT